MTNTHKYDETTSTAKPYETTITMNVKDIKKVTEEDLEKSRTIEEHERLLLKVYWYLKGIDRSTITRDEGSKELQEEIEELIYV